MHYLPYTKEIGNVKITLWEEPEPCAIADAFDHSCHDIEGLCDKVRRGLLSWSVFFVTVEVNGIELGRDVLGGIMLDPHEDDPVEYARDNVMFKEAITQARQKLDELSDFGRNRNVEDVVHSIEQEIRNIPYGDFDKAIHFVSNHWNWENAAPFIRLMTRLIRLKNLTGPSNNDR